MVLTKPYLNNESNFCMYRKIHYEKAIKYRTESATQSIAISIDLTTVPSTVDMDTFMNRYSKSGDMRLLGKKSAFLCA